MTNDKGDLIVTTTPPAEAELQESNEQATALLAEIEALEIKTPEDMVRGAELLVKVKRYSGQLGDRKDEIVKPIKAGLKSLEDLFRPVTKAFGEAESKAKGQIVDYRQTVRESREEYENELLLKVENGELTLDEAIAEMEKVPGLDKIIQTDAGKVQSRKTKTVEIIARNELPDEYLVPDMSLIRTDALGIGKDDNGNQRVAKKIPGVKVDWKETLAA